MMSMEMGMKTCLWFLLGSLVSGDNKICPNSHSTPTGHPRFLDVAESTDVQIHLAIYIKCCAENYDNITWFRKSLTHDQWEPYPPASKDYDPSGSKVTEQQQVLRISRSTVSDNTTFQCNLIKGDQQQQHVTRLWVVSCDELARGPRLTSPFPVNRYVNDAGGDVSLYCTGYFGCTNFSGGLGTAMWYIRTKYGNFTLAQNASPRYNVTHFSRLANTVLGSALRIQSVQQEDFDREFVCYLSSSQIKDPSTNKTVQIHLLPKKYEVPDWLIWTASGVVGLVIIIVILSCCLHRCFGPQIKWFLRSRMTCLGPDPYKEGTYIYNIFFYHSEESPEDEKLAESICTKLKAENYTVRMSSDIRGGQGLMDANQQEVEQSALVVFLFTEDLMKNPFTIFFLKSLIEFREGRGILFLEVAKYEPETVRNRTIEAAVNNHLAVPAIEKDRAIETDGARDDDDEATVVHHGDEHANGRNENQTAGNKANGEKRKEFDLNFWKGLPRLKVPSEEASARRKKNFHCALKNKIPMSKNQLKRETDSTSTRKTSGKGRNSSSGTPLLSSTCESPFVVNEIGQGDDKAVSPNSDSVFTYENLNTDETIKKHVGDSRDSVTSILGFRQTPRSQRNSSDNLPLTHVEVHRDGDMVSHAEPASPLHEDTDDISEQRIFTMSGEQTDLDLSLPNSLSPTLNQRQSEITGHATNMLDANHKENGSSAEMKLHSSGYISLGIGDGVGQFLNGGNQTNASEKTQENKPTLRNCSEHGKEVTANPLVREINLRDKGLAIPSKHGHPESSVENQNVSPESGYDTASPDQLLSSNIDSAEPFLKQGQHGNQQVMLEPSAMR